MSVSEKKTDLTTASANRSPARRPPLRPNASSMLTKLLGVVLLLSTVGLASCQAMWAETLAMPFFLGPWN